MVRNKHVSPSVNETAFSCPHCGAFASQTWYRVFVQSLTEGDRLPHISFNEENILLLSQNGEIPIDIANGFIDCARKLKTGLIFFDEKDANYLYISAHNIHLSSCYNCQKVAVWVHDRLVSPPELQGEDPSSDMPADILQDYEEARSILKLSPRGAAALLRLAIQKLCKHLGEKGKKIDDDIASLVQKGLNPMVQQALDAVRVIGNEAVHPGSLDLRDDRDTASELFSLVNLIVDQMITHPKRVSDMYNRLPSDKRAAIATRDAKKP